MPAGSSNRHSDSQTGEILKAEFHQIGPLPSSRFNRASNTPRVAAYSHNQLSQKGILRMSLIERFSEYVRACFTGLWIESHEHQDALMAIAQLCRQEQWRLATWDIEQGLQVDGTPLEANGSDPLAAIRAINSLATSDGTAILVLQNFHRFLQSAEIVQALSQQVIAGKQNRTIVVVLSPVVQLPVELEKLFVVLEHELPDRAQLAEIARGHCHGRLRTAGRHGTGHGAGCSGRLDPAGS